MKKIENLFSFKKDVEYIKQLLIKTYRNLSTEDIYKDLFLYFCTLELVWKPFNNHNQRYYLKDKHS